MTSKEVEVQIHAVRKTEAENDGASAAMIFSYIVNLPMPIRH